MFVSLGEAISLCSMCFPKASDSGLTQYPPLSISVHPLEKQYHQSRSVARTPFSRLAQR
jgi:hypothetical protein